MRRKPALLHVKTVRRGGKDYLYFNTGQKVAGKPVRTRLPFKDDPSFGTAYATAMANLTKRSNAPNVLSVPALISLYEKAPALRKRSQGTQKTYGVYLRQLGHAFNNAPAMDVEARDIYALIDKMADRPSAADMLLLVARNLFRWGKKHKHANIDPTEGIEAIAESREYEPWPEHLVEAALEDAKVRVAVALLYFTAQRIGDVCRIRWSDIRGGVLHVKQQKTGKELEIPIHQRLAAILASEPRTHLTILSDRRGRHAKDQTVRGWLQGFAAEQGFKVVPHGLRKNAVNALLEAGCSTGETSSISGQSLQMVEHYAKRRNNPKMAGAAILKWEQAGNGETVGKTGPERRGNA